MLKEENPGLKKCGFAFILQEEQHYLGREKMDWMYLVLAGLFEISWPTGFKIAQTSAFKAGWIGFSCAGMAVSGLFLYLAQRSIPVGVAYATWTGIGALGTFLLGVVYFGDNATFLSWLGVCLIICGIAALKASHLLAS